MTLSSMTHIKPVMKQNAANGPVDCAGSTSELRYVQNDDTFLSPFSTSMLGLAWAMKLVLCVNTEL